jgi:hypothetical protein
MKSVSVRILRGERRVGRYLPRRIDARNAARGS